MPLLGFLYGALEQGYTSTAFCARVNSCSISTSAMTKHRVIDIAQLEVLHCHQWWKYGDSGPSTATVEWFLNWMLSGFTGNLMVTVPLKLHNIINNNNKVFSSYAERKYLSFVWLDNIIGGTLGVQFSLQLSGTVLHAYYFGISKIRNGMERMDGTNRTVDLCICDQSTTYLLSDESWAVL